MKKVKIGNQILTQSFLIIFQQKNATTQIAPAMFPSNRDIWNHFPLLNKTRNLSNQEKAKRNNTNSKIKSKTRYDKTMNVKISDIKVGDQILAKQ